MGNASARLDPERLLAESGWVRALARSLVGPSDVDDIVQETWRVVLERPPQLNDATSSLRGWLATVMRNLVQRSRRGERMRGDYIERVGRELTSNEGDVHERVLLHRHLVDAVLELDEPYKSAIVLRYFDGLTPREIAAKQTVSYDTARQRLSRGLATLRARLDRDYCGKRATWSALCLGVVQRKAAIASSVVIGGIVVSVKSLSVVAAALVLAVASWWWLRGTGVGLSNANAIGAQPTQPLSASARGSSDAERTERLAVAANERIDDHASSDVVPESDAKQIAGSVDVAFEPRLDAIAASFLTEQPDFRGLAALWDEFAAAASILPDSVTGDGTRTVGELSLPGSNVRAKFEIANDSYRISFDKLCAQDSASPYFQRSVTLAFRHTPSGVLPGASSVQFHPDTGRPASRVLHDGEERVLGWTVFERDRRVQARPITARAADDGTSWMIGQSPTRSDIEAVYGVDGKAEQALFELLANSASKR